MVDKKRRNKMKKIILLYILTTCLQANAQILNGPYNCYEIKNGLRSIEKYPMVLTDDTLTIYDKDQVPAIEVVFIDNHTGEWISKSDNRSERNENVTKYTVKSQTRIQSPMGKNDYFLLELTYVNPENETGLMTIELNKKERNKERNSVELTVHLEHNTKYPDGIIVDKQRHNAVCEMN